MRLSQRLAIATLAGGIGIADANAQEPREMIGSLQSDGKIRYNWPVGEEQQRGNRTLFQQTRTDTIYAAEDGTILNDSADPKADYFPATRCVIQPDPHNQQIKVEVVCPTFSGFALR